MKKMKIALVLSLLLVLTGCITPQNYIADKVTSGNSDSTSVSLDLKNKNLDKIPEYVFDMTSLQELDVSNNNLMGSIQAEIRHLKNLKVLRAGNNNMTGVPAEIGQLSKLEVLDLSNNNLTGLPLELGNLKNLKTLNLSGNDYSEYDLGIITKSLPSDVEIIK